MAGSRPSAVTVAVAAVFFFFLFSFAYARAPLDLPENGVTTTHTVDLPDSNVKITGEKPETKISESQVTEIESKPDSKENDRANSVSLTVVTFRPTNRRFSGHPLFPFRRGHGCHQHRRFNRFKVKDGQRSYGDDMILSEGVNSGFERQIPVSWTKHKHGSDGIFAFTNQEDTRDEVNNMARHHHHRRRRHHHHHDEEEEEGLKKHGKHKLYKSEFMKGIRKFLNNF